MLLAESSIGHSHYCLLQASTGRLARILHQVAGSVAVDEEVALL